MRIMLGASLAAVWLAAVPVASRAEQASPAANDDCLACHADPAAARADRTSVAVDAASFTRSVHGPLACVECHQDLAALKEYPHPDRLERARCAACHDTAQQKYAGSVHAEARRNGRTLAASCVDCHGTHDIRPASDPASPTHHLNLPGTCAKCHGNREIIARGHIRIGDVASKFHDSIHGRALERSGLTVAPSCVDCHGNHDVRRSRDPSSQIFHANVPATCGRCHVGIVRRYEISVHAAALKRADSRAPVCVDCHTAHAIQRVDSEPWRLEAARECGTCHADVVESFTRTFHGKVTQLGFTRVAACADCHGAHDILPASNPASMVAPARLVSTCGRCHAGANASFVKYDPHPNPHDYRRGPLLWWINRFYTILIAGCFGFFGLHSALWFRRSWKDPSREGGGARDSGSPRSTSGGQGPPEYS